MCYKINMADMNWIASHIINASSMQVLKRSHGEFRLSFWSSWHLCKDWLLVQGWYLQRITALVPSWEVGWLQGVVWGSDTAGVGSCLQTASWMWGSAWAPLQSVQLEGYAAAARERCSNPTALGALLAAPAAAWVLAHTHLRAKPPTGVSCAVGWAPPGQCEHAARCRAAVSNSLFALSKYFWELPAIPTFSACFSWLFLKTRRSLLEIWDGL